MVQVRSSGSAVAQPKPKYGYLSEIDPDFVPLREETDKNFAAVWALPVDEFKLAWLNAPPSLPENPPQPGKDYKVSDQQIPVRDGAKVGLRLYKPVEPVENAVLVLKAHGGGWVVGTHHTEECENRMLAAHAKAVVASVDYRMAPEFKFPYAINDCFDALKWCKANAAALGVNPETIVVAGGSCGGTMSAVLALMARDEKVSGVIGQVLNIPATCHPKHFPTEKYEYGSYEQNKDGSVVDAPRMDWFWEQYLPHAGPEAYASPLLAKDLSNLPPALIQVAGLDPLRDEGLAYAEALRAAGTTVTLKTYKGLPHGFYMFPNLKQTHEYWASTVDFVTSLTSGSKL